MATMNQALIRLYANLIRGGRRTLETIPAEYRDGVSEELKKVE